MAEVKGWNLFQALRTNLGYLGIIIHPPIRQQCAFSLPSILNTTPASASIRYRAGGAVSLYENKAASDGNKCAHGRIWAVPDTLKIQQIPSPFLKIISYRPCFTIEIIQRMLPEGKQTLVLVLTTCQAQW